MNSRRSFIKKIGAGAAFSTVAFSSSAAFNSLTDPGANDEKSLNQRLIKIGIIGAENSHTIGYWRLFNIEKKFPGVTVEYVWGETEEFAREAAEKGKIPNIVKDPKEMLGKIDALIVDHRHAKYHLESAIPFIKAGFTAETKLVSLETSELLFIISTKPGLLHIDSEIAH